MADNMAQLPHVSWAAIKGGRRNFDTARVVVVVSGVGVPVSTTVGWPIRGWMVVGPTMMRRWMDDVVPTKAVTPSQEEEVAASSNSCGSSADTHNTMLVVQFDLVLLVVMDALGGTRVDGHIVVWCDEGRPPFWGLN